MTAITIPREITGGEEFVVIPQKLYEKFLRILVLSSQTRRTLKLDKNLREALTDVEQGRTIGPFTTLSEGLRALKNAA